jgi:hypothetical protein
MEELINIFWSGPFSLTELRTFNSQESDFGIYQIYTHHPVYGKTLTYIGQAREQTFAVRVAQHNWGSGAENDPSCVDVYIGRLIGRTPSLAQWRSQIDRAEKLLIHSHAPAYNTHCIQNPPSEAECGNVRVLNWGACRSLSREVSGLMWTSAALKLREQGPYQAPAEA